MKKIFIILIIFSVSVVSCHKELESEIYSNISPTTFPKTADDVEAAVTTVYNPLRTWYRAESNGLYSWPELSTDIMTTEWGGYWIPLSTFGWNENNADATQMFLQYNKISRGTLTIDRIKDVNMNEELKERFIAEIKCINAWLAWILYDLYGPIPIATLEILKNPAEEIILERPTNKWMVDYIATNLLEAAEILPVSYEAKDWGRVTQGSALMILLKLYMHEKDWTNAEITARKIIGLNQYNLLPDYPSIFTKENQRNNEIIYAIPTHQEAGFAWHAHVLPSNYVTNNSSIQKWNGFRMHWSFFDTYESNDKRLNTIISEYTGSNGILYNRNNPGNFLSKGVVPMKYGEDPDQIGTMSSIDIIIFRYAEVLLSLSEAIANKKGTPDQECIDLVNYIRNRAGLEDIFLSDFSNLADFNEMILLERGHELYCEGGRRSDQIRHGTYVEFGKTILGNQAFDYKKLFPLPQSAIDEGRGKIIQNSGY